MFGIRKETHGKLNISLIEDLNGITYVRYNINNDVYQYYNIKHENDKNIMMTSLYKLIKDKGLNGNILSIDIRTNNSESLELLNEIKTMFDEKKTEVALLNRNEQLDVMFLMAIRKKDSNIPMSNLLSPPPPRYIPQKSGKNKSNHETEKNNVTFLEETEEEKIVIYTDASKKDFKNNENKTGYGIAIYHNENKKNDILYKIKAKVVISKKIDDLEAFAIRRGLKFIKTRIEKGEFPKNLKYEIRSDSLNNILYLNNLRVVPDKKNKILINIIQDIQKLSQDLNISYKWVKSHGRDMQNNTVDVLAKESLKHKNNSFIVAYKNEDILKKVKNKFSI